MRALGRQWIDESDRSRRPWLLHALAVCWLFGISLPCKGANALPEERIAQEALNHMEAAQRCLISGDDVCATREASWLKASSYPEIGKVFSGFVLYQGKRYDEALHTVESVYPIESPKGASPALKDFYLWTQALAACMIGSAKLQLKQPDAEALPFLLDGTKYRTRDGFVVEDEALDFISEIYIRQNRFGLSFGFGLEWYNIVKMRYNQAALGPGKQQLERNLHAAEYRFAILLAAMGDIDESGEWLKKAIRYKDGDYQKQASETALLKPVLESIRGQKNPQ